MFTQHLQRCNNLIELDPVEKSVFSVHYELIRNYVIEKMKAENELFSKIFHETQLFGSYADELKISRPNEYSLLIILKLPVFNRMEMIVDEVRPGYVKMKTFMPRNWYGSNIIIDHNGFLMHYKVLGWLQTIMQEIFPHKPR